MIHQSATWSASYSASTGVWNYNVNGLETYTITISGGPSPTTASGSLTYKLLVLGGNGYSPQYTFNVTAAATDSGVYSGGTWDQTAENTDTINASGFQWGTGLTTETYTYCQPYSSGSSGRPVTGMKEQTADYQVSYYYDNKSCLGSVESSGSYSDDYSGGGSGSSAGGITWSEDEDGGDSSWTCCSSRSFSAFSRTRALTLLAAQPQGRAAANCASAITWSRADLTDSGQVRGRGMVAAWNVAFVMGSTSCGIIASWQAGCNWHCNATQGAAGLKGRTFYQSGVVSASSVNQNLVTPRIDALIRRG